jgi:hypothetical protein
VIRNLASRDCGILTSAGSPCQGCNKKGYNNQGADITTVEEIGDGVITKNNIREIDIKMVYG